MLLQKKMWLEYIRIQDYLVFWLSIFSWTHFSMQYHPLHLMFLRLLRHASGENFAQNYYVKAGLSTKLNKCMSTHLNVNANVLVYSNANSIFFQDSIQMHVLSILSHIMKKLIYFFAFLESKAILGTLNYLTNICSDNICCLTNTSHVKVPRLMKLKKINTTE